jgi:hypothetical protein
VTFQRVAADANKKTRPPSQVVRDGLKSVLARLFSLRWSQSTAGFDPAIANGIAHISDFANMH